MHELTNEQQAELRRYIERHGEEVIQCVALSMLAENGYSGDVWAMVAQIEAEVSDGTN